MAKAIEKCINRTHGQEKCVRESHISDGAELLNTKLLLQPTEYTVEVGECEQLELLKLKVNAPTSAISITPAFHITQVENNFPMQNIKRKKTQQASSIVHFASESGTMLLQMQGKKDRLKHLIRDTLLKSFGRLIGLCEGRQRAKIIRVLNGVVKFKKDAIPSKRVLQERDANRLLAEVHLMERFCSESDKILLPGMVEAINHSVVKYWLRRYSLFSRFDEGIKIDEEGLFSVTPEEIAKHQAAHCGSSGIVIDAFTGVGGNAIQFACMNFNVIAIDIDPKRIEYARHNAEVYGVAHKIDFIVGDFFQLAPTLKGDVVFLSPPWGGPEYIKADKYDIETMIRPANGFSLFKLALTVAPSVAYFLPRTVDVEQLSRLSWLSSPPLPYEIERNYVRDELKAVTAYYGNIASRKIEY
ncbi:hypothetical protein GOP47_0015550 [Adiantum capillus-veneris]|uniref:Trimethylguanosine synthase n=1 Tax=Adiantum capillus-veneris TaxID=13818 RepID=A0A9D4ZBR7_ADICA|nr:hypothetical protein GOP47_0015550 [Adiantum capillus-veneris]